MQKFLAQKNTDKDTAAQNVCVQAPLPVFYFILFCLFEKTENFDFLKSL